MKLVIVESPNKTKAIAKYLGKDYQVAASFGHVRDLSTTGKYNLGVDIENDFKPTYEILPKKEWIIKRLQNMVDKADEVYLATDPDREGEAIAWHLYEILNLKEKDCKRLVFNEITKYGIEKGLANPRPINMDTVDSQEVRRIMDRIIGFRLSYLVQNKLGQESAGRVQSATLRLIVDREKEIAAFEPEEAYKVQAKLTKNLKATITKYQGKELKIKSQAEAEKVIAELGNVLVVKDLTQEETSVKPRFPLTTSNLLREASNYFGFSANRTMKLAQTLFESVNIGKKTTGLITYHRTDSIQLSPIFINQAKQFINDNFGPEYVGKAYVQKETALVQGAHEAIRPIDINIKPDDVREYLNLSQYKIYKLIYVRALASIMTAKKLIVHKSFFEAQSYEAEASSNEVIFPGHSVLDSWLSTSKKEGYQALDYQIGDSVKVKDYLIEDVSTKPPARYSEGQLVKKMEETGIGRPSTYAVTIEKLREHYIQVEKGLIYPLPQGELVDEKLREYIKRTINVEYTAKMEKYLDKIETKEVDKLEVLKEFNDNFVEELKNALEHMPTQKTIEVKDEVCPKCGKALVYRNGKFGSFIGCSDFPSCNYIKPKEVVIPKNAKVCPKCGQGHLITRQGKYGSFLGCSRFPDCDYMEPFKKRKYFRKSRKKTAA
ncbi:MAG: type I DNA topoisomerase [Bacilli bacterium]|jgi:DNA topoisomerase-1